MSGHSKWANIKRQKEVKDMARGNIFSKLSRAITLAVIEGGGITDPAGNVKLRLAIEKAKQFNMPKDNIQKAIDRGAGPSKNQLKEVIYEGFGPHGIVIIIQSTTDNPNRTLSEIRNVLEKHGGKLGNQGAVSYLFQKCSSIVIEKTKASQNQVFELAEKIDGFDIEENERSFTVYFPYENLGKAGEAEVDYKPTTLIKIENENKTKTILSLVEALEQLDDVQRVFTNSA